MSNVKESDLKNCITNSQNPIALELNLDLEFDNSDFFMNLVLIFVGFFMVFEIVKTFIS